MPSFSSTYKLPVGPSAAWRRRHASHRFANRGLPWRMTFCRHSCCPPCTRDKRGAHFRHVLDVTRQRLARNTERTCAGWFRFPRAGRSCWGASLPHYHTPTRRLPTTNATYARLHATHAHAHPRAALPTRCTALHAPRTCLCLHQQTFCCRAGCGVLP